MGYCKLTYDGYMERIDYWMSQGVEMPHWADELSAKGFESVCAIDFYDDLFGEDLEPHRLPEDYRTGEYGGIVVERIPGEDGKKPRARRVTVTQGNMELYDLIDESENFCMMAPISYAGKNRSNKNARYLYALCLEIDNIIPESGINELVYSWKRTAHRMPQPTYIVCSGNGLHLYFVFERPIPLFQNLFEQLTAVKKHLTPLFWNRYVTKSHERNQIQYESLNQPFRCVGSRTKSNSYAMAFKTGEKITIEYLNNLLPEKLQIAVRYKSNLPLSKAKELYPEWYQKRIVEGRERGHWNRYEPIYYNWIEKIKDGAVVGRRYNCLENLCSLAVQCNIAPEQVEADCRDVAEVFEKLTNDEKNHFTEYDVLCAMRTYHQADEGAYRRKIDVISAKTGIPLVPNRRNGRRQDEHLEEARAIRDIRMRRQGRDWRDGNGRPDVSKIVEEWRENNPDGTKAACIRETGLSKPTVYKWWDGPEQAAKPKKEAQNQPHELDPGLLSETQIQELLGTLLKQSETLKEVLTVRGDSAKLLTELAKTLGSIEIKNDMD